MPISIDRKTAALTLDLESDYASGSLHALRAVDRLLNLLVSHKVPITVFVEGWLIDKCSDLLKKMSSDHVDIQLHCYDHKEAGETAESLKQSVALYRRHFNHSPQGYRAHTFQLTRELLHELNQHGFLWDSSVLPAIVGYGANRDTGWRFHNACFRLNRQKLIEFPVAVCRNLKIPFIHSYYRMAGVFRNWVYSEKEFPRLFVYDMHMVDLVYSLSSLSQASIPKTAKLFYRLGWMGRSEDSFQILSDLILKLKRMSYRFLLLKDLYLESCNL